MLRLLGFITLIYIIYRWIVQPLLILPNERQRRKDPQAQAMDWLQEQLRQHQQNNAPRSSSNNNSGRSRQTTKNEGEYVDYEEVD